MGNIEFRNNLTEGTSVKGKKEVTQYRALGTPKGRITASEKLSPILIFCFRFERYKTVPSTTRQYHLDQTSHVSSHIEGNDQSCQTPLTGLIMLGPLPFLSPLRKLYHFESSTMQFQWSGNSYKQTG